MGANFAEVLDGIRPSTERERIYAFWKQIKVGVYSDLSLKGRTSGGSEVTIDYVDDRADILALLILAPVRDVLMNVVNGNWEARRRSVIRVLTQTYGLPADCAEVLGVRLLAANGKGES